MMMLLYIIFSFDRTMRRSMLKDVLCRWRSVLSTTLLLTIVIIIAVVVFIRRFSQFQVVSTRSSSSLLLLLLLIFVFRFRYSTLVVRSCIIVATRDKVGSGTSITIGRVIRILITTLSAFPFFSRTPNVGGHD